MGYAPDYGGLPVGRLKCSQKLPLRKRRIDTPFRGARWGRGLTVKQIATQASERARCLSPPQAEAFSWVLLGVLTLILVAGYGSSLAETAVYWKGPQYSHGWLIPVIAGVLLWLRRQPLEDVPPRQRWYGLGLLGAGLGGRLLCVGFGLDVPEMWTFVPSLAGLVLLVGGWSMFRWAGPAVGFLLFMFPLPWSAEQALLAPLQSLATQVSTFALQTLGVEAYREGNRICIGQLQLGVVDACSGLRMTTVFLALTVAMVLIAERPWWERGVMLLSAVPIALTVNVLRITITGLAHLYVGSEWASFFFHDAAGYVMIVLAVVMLWMELVVLSHLFVDVEIEDPAGAILGRQ